MTLPTYPTAFVDDLSTITADFLNNYVRTQIPKAIDGSGGGTYTPTAKITIDGSNGLEIGGAHRLKLASRSLTRAQTSFLFNISGPALSPTGAVVAPGITWYQELLVPHNAQITAVTAWVDPTDDTLPTNNVSLSVTRTDISTGTVTPLGASPVVDPNTGATYQSHHSFSVSGLTETVDRTKYRYYASLQGESGGDTDNCVWYGVTVTYTTTEQDDGY